MSGLLFSVMALMGALGHHFCGRLIWRIRLSSRGVIVGGAATACAVGWPLIGASGNLWIMTCGIGGYARHRRRRGDDGELQRRRRRVIPARAHGAGFGVLTSASLVGMASSPFFAGSCRRRLRSASSSFVDLAAMALVVAARATNAMVDLSVRRAFVDPCCAAARCDPGGGEIGIRRPAAWSRSRPTRSYGLGRPIRFPLPQLRVIFAAKGRVRPSARCR